MDTDGAHHVPRIDDTVTPANLHERAEAVAVPDFDYLEQGIAAIVNGLTGHRRSAKPPAQSRRSAHTEPVTDDR